MHAKACKKVTSGGKIFNDVTNIHEKKKKKRKEKKKKISQNIRRYSYTRYKITKNESKS